MSEEFPPGRAKHDSAHKVAIQRRRARALELRAMGWTQSDIAAELGVSRECISVDIRKALREITRVPAHELVATHQKALLLYRKALEAKIEAGNVPAILAAIKCLEHEAKLMNLLSPTTEIRVSGGADFAATANALLLKIARNQGMVSVDGVVVDSEDVPGLRALPDLPKMP